MVYVPKVHIIKTLNQTNPQKVKTSLRISQTNRFSATHSRINTPPRTQPARETMSSRWADTAEDAAEDARRKAEKEEKKRLKAEKQRLAEEAQRAEAAKANGHANEGAERPSKRRRLSGEDAQNNGPSTPLERKLLRFEAPAWQPCRSVERFDRLNQLKTN
jgi:hypothetical protein